MVSLPGCMRIKAAIATAADHSTSQAPRAEPVYSQPYPDSSTYSVTSSWLSTWHLLLILCLTWRTLAHYTQDSASDSALLTSWLSISQLNPSANTFPQPELKSDFSLLNNALFNFCLLSSFWPLSCNCSSASGFGTIHFQQEGFIHISRDSSWTICCSNPVLMTHRVLLRSSSLFLCDNSFYN